MRPSGWSPAGSVQLEPDPGGPAAIGMTSPPKGVALNVEAPDLVATLEAERERRLAHVAALRRAFIDMLAASEDSNADDEHDPEGATIAFERSQLGAQIAHADARVKEADDAIARVAAGDYGVCRSCGEPITVARLEARPTATTCITCAS